MWVLAWPVLPKPINWVYHCFLLRRPSMTTSNHVDTSLEVILEPMMTSLSVTYMYYFLYGGDINMSSCTASLVNSNYKQIASCAGCQPWTTNPTVSKPVSGKHAGHSYGWQKSVTTHGCVQHAYHSTLTHPSKSVQRSCHPYTPSGQRSLWSDSFLHNESVMRG